MLEDRHIFLGTVPEAERVDFLTAPPCPWLVENVPWTEAEHRIAAIAAEPPIARALEIATGTDVALETASAALLRNRVTDMAAMIRLAWATMGNIRQNVTIALGLKAVFLVTTIFGLTGLWIAIMADTGATVLVTLNALRMLRFDPEQR